MPGFEFFGAEERKEVEDVLNSGILMRYGFDVQRDNHWKARELESAINEYVGVKHTHLVSSGTAALSVALAALGIGAGDEVIMPSFTFVASFEAVLSVGAVPVIADVDDTLTLSPASVSQLISPKTKAIMPVHMCGGMADMDALVQLCNTHNLLLLEDACQSFGASYKGQYLGSIGHAGAFSFDFVKTITCGEGGAVVTNDRDIYLRADAYSDHGHDHLGVDRGADLHPFIGYNFRISELHAAVGLAQIRKVDQILSLQRKYKRMLKVALAELPGITFRRLPDEHGDNASFLSIFLPDENTARKTAAAMKAAGLPAFYWYDNNWHYFRNWEHFQQSKTLYRLSAEQENAMAQYSGKQFPESDAIMSRCISMPINLNQSYAELESRKEKMVTVMKEIL